MFKIVFTYTHIHLFAPKSIISTMNRGIYRFSNEIESVSHAEHTYAHLTDKYVKN